MAPPDDSKLNVSGLLVATDADGLPLYTLTQIEDFVAATLIATEGDVRELPAELVELLDRFCQRAGVDPTGHPHNVETSIAQYFERYPIPTTLQNGFGRALRAAFLSGDPEDMPEALRSIGVDEARPAHPDAADEPHPDSVGTGALGYFAAKEKFSKSRRDPKTDQRRRKPRT